MVELAASAKALSIPYHNFNDYLRASGLLLLKGTGKNSNKTEAQGSNIMSIDFFKREAKNFLKDWQTQTITTNTDGSNSYHYDWKFYDVDYHFNKLKLDDKDRLDIKLARSQHWLAQILGQKNWNVLVSLTDFELDNAEELLRRIKNHTLPAPGKNQIIQDVPCFRLRCMSEMTLKDKENFEISFTKIKAKIIESIKDIDFWLDHFDKWDTVDDNGREYTFYERREYLKKKLKNNKQGYAKLIFKSFKKFYNDPDPDPLLTLPIMDITEQLGIRIYKANFGTDKISGFCTSFMEYRYGAEIEEPIIVINLAYCNTPEKYLKEIAKQLYFMIAKSDEFDYKAENGIRYEIKSSQTEAEKFVEDFFIPTDRLNVWLKNNRNVKNAPVVTPEYKESFSAHYSFQSLINYMKNKFYVDYKTAIKRLLESDWKNKHMFDSYESAETYYLESLKQYDEKTEYKIRWLNGEPEPLYWEVVEFFWVPQEIK